MPNPNPFPDYDDEDDDESDFMNGFYIGAFGAAIVLGIVFLATQPIVPDVIEIELECDIQSSQSDTYCIPNSTEVLRVQVRDTSGNTYMELSFNGTEYSSVSASSEHTEYVVLIQDG
ncbi:MAG: hypothetical protein KAJ24_03155 [Candidatus Aenigmarchaeota archaeon]|nr:hypothetical protein [Candidatus Aenigmarchaeota archaeon]